MTTDTETPTTNGTQAPSQPQQGMQLSPTEKKITSKLRDNVDERGNFKFKLRDYSLGFAAGRNISEVEASKQIKAMFQKEMGTDIKTYLENDRVAKGLEVDRDS